jgi:GNAT superfamily N-acetyltransferase
MSHRALNPEQFEFFKAPSKKLGDFHKLTYGREGVMLWHSRTGELEHIEVAPRQRRQGIATGLWREAHRLATETGVTPPQHSPKRTKTGDAWARSLGESLPERHEWRDNEEQ